MHLDPRGVTQHGLLPDFLADLRAIGVSDPQIDAILDSACVYAALWNQTEAASWRLRLQ
jgi:hypothetical protein